MCVCVCVYVCVCVCLLAVVYRYAAFVRMDRLCVRAPRVFNARADARVTLKRGGGSRAKPQIM
jgi:hypothetical protein